MEKRNFLITTRPAEKNRQTANASCFEIKNVPLTRIVRNANPKKLKEQLEKYSPNIVVLTSSIGSEILLKAEICGIRTIMCIGKRTAEPFLRSGLEVLVPIEQNSSGLIELISLQSRKESRIALCRSKQHNTLLDDYLASEGYNYRCFDLYEIEELHSSNLERMLFNKECKGLILTSSMEAVSLAHLLGNDVHSKEFSDKTIFCIGKPTYETARRQGFDCEMLNKKAMLRQLLRKYLKNTAIAGNGFEPLIYGL